MLDAVVDGDCKARYLLRRVDAMLFPHHYYNYLGSRLIGYNKTPLCMCVCVCVFGDDSRFATRNHCHNAFVAALIFSSFFQFESFYYPKTFLSLTARFSVSQFQDPILLDTGIPSERTQRERTRRETNVTFKRIENDPSISLPPLSRFSVYPMPVCSTFATPYSCSLYRV